MTVLDTNYLCVKLGDKYIFRTRHVFASFLLAYISNVSGNIRLLMNR